MVLGEGAIGRRLQTGWNKTMKKIICAALALTLLGSTAAEAHGWHGGWHGHHGRGDVALGFGLGFLALGIIAAESVHDRDQAYRDRHAYYDGRDGDRDGDGYDRSRNYDNDGDRADGYRGGDNAQGAPAPLHRDNRGDDDGDN